MDLQFLNGLGDAALYRDVNDQYLMSLDDELGELGKLLAKKSKIPGAKTNLFAKIKDEVAAKKAQAPPADPLALPKKKKKGFLKKVLNVVNKINPATVLLRNGLLTLSDEFQDVPRRGFRHKRSVCLMPDWQVSEWEFLVKNGCLNCGVKMKELFLCWICIQDKA